MDENKKRAYSEIVEILKLIEEPEKLENIPFEVIQMFKNNADAEYKPVISKDIPLEEQNLMNETWAILNWIATKYWNMEEQNIEQEKIEENIEKEEIINEENIAEKEPEYVSVYNDIEEESLEGNDNLPMVIDNTKWYKKIIQFIKKIFSWKKRDIKEGV